MATYRAYLVDDKGHFVDVHVLSACRTDDDAIVAAKEFANGYDVQIWALARFVATVVAEDKLRRTG